MKINNYFQNYISGKSFHNDLNFPISDSQHGNDTIWCSIDSVEEHCCEKRVLHVGCAEHIELFKSLYEVSVVSDEP